MKKVSITWMMVFALAVSLSGLYGCDKKNDDNSRWIILALLDQGLTVNNVTPANGATGVALNATIVIRFDRPTDGSTTGTVELDGTTYQSGLPTVSAWEYNTDHTILTITRANAFITYTVYDNLIVSGFVDENGKVMKEHHDMGYAFTTVPLQVVSIWPPDNSNPWIPVDITITFNGNLDTTVGSQQASLSSNFGTTLVFNIGSGEIDIAGATVTVHGTDRIETGTYYSNLILENFKAADGGSIPTYTTDPDYGFQPIVE